MIVELLPDIYFDNVNQVGPLHVVMNYGITCGPCKITMPQYELLYNHFVEYKVTNVKFYRFHSWEEDFQQFIKDNNLKPNGVPTFRFYYNGEVVDEVTGAYPDANDLKKKILEVCDAIHVTMGGFDLYKTY